jgi:AraC family transcriptional regulator
MRRSWPLKSERLLLAGISHALQWQAIDSLALVASGGTRLTGNKISTVPRYEGADRAGSISFIPSGAERRGWYRDADMRFVALLVDPRAVASPPVELLRPRINRHDRRLEALLRRLAGILIANDGASTLHIAQLSAAVLAHLGGVANRAATALSSADFERTVDLIEARLGSRLSLGELGANVGMDADLFARKFKARLGESPYRYVTQRRVERAQELLGFGAASLAEIALVLGFAHQSHFTRQFARATGPCVAKCLLMAFASR